MVFHFTNSTDCLSAGPFIGGRLWGLIWAVPGRFNDRRRLNRSGGGRCSPGRLRRPKGGANPQSGPRNRIATTFQPSCDILASMGIRPDDSKKAVRALLRRRALLRAYIEALDRIDGPNHRRRAAESRLEHRPRRDLPPCRVLHFATGPKSAAGPQELSRNSPHPGAHLASLTRPIAKPSITTIRPFICASRIPHGGGIVKSANQWLPATE
jgi:hypothetical protein